MATIRSIVYQPSDKTYDERLDFFIRVPLDEVDLIAGHGIAGDEKAGHHPERQLNLISAEWLQNMQARGFKIKPGEFGEQLVVEDLAVEELQTGERVQLGHSAVIEITKARTGCERLELVQGEIDEDTKRVIGMMSKVITGGTIRVGDTVKLLSPVKEV